MAQEFTSLKDFTNYGESNEGKIWMIMYTATWGKPNEDAYKEYEKLIKEYEGDDSLSFTVSDVDKNKELTDHFELHVCPLFHFYNGKKKLEGDVEGNHIEDVRKKLTELFPKPEKEKVDEKQIKS